MPQTLSAGTECCYPFSWQNGVPVTEHYPFILRPITGETRVAGPWAVGPMKSRESLLWWALSRCLLAKLTGHREPPSDQLTVTAGQTRLVPDRRSDAEAE